MMRIFPITCALLLVAIMAVVIAGCGNATGMAPEPRLVLRDVPMPVVVRCKDARPAAPDFPDTDEKIAAVPDDPGAIFTLATIYRAARELYLSRLAQDDVQIRSCAGE